MSSHRGQVYHCANLNSPNNDTMVDLTPLALIAGARSVDESIRIWGDSVLRRIGGWLYVMDATTMGRIFKTATAKHVYQMERFNHVLRGRAWKRARTFTSRLIRESMWNDVPHIPAFSPCSYYMDTIHPFRST